MLIAGDIGGTNTRLAVYTLDGGPRSPLYEAQYASWDYPNLQTIVAHFLAEAKVEAQYAVFGIPGPVVHGRATGTNIPWTVDEMELAQVLGLRWVRLLNDLQAIATAVPILRADELVTLAQGEPDPTGPIAVLAPGTGLGEAYLVWDGARYRPQASEGGHTDWAPAGEVQIELLRFLQARYGHVSCERVCSGRGLPNIYAFLRDTGRAEEPRWLAEALAAVEDPTPLIVEAALKRDPPVPLCQQTLEMLVAILAAQAGNVALHLLATGGVYLAGGMPPHLLPLLQREAFLKAFCGKGRLSYMLERIPVHVIVQPEVGRLGAAHYGLECAYSQEDDRANAAGASR
ncbi:MAG: glucokinase [Chloroflexi bacterium]|nr:glucokinase [Chloroflexota bacterium]